MSTVEEYRPPERPWGDRVPDEREVLEAFEQYVHTGIVYAAAMRGPGNTPMKVFIVQLNARDHAGEIILVTTDETEAYQFAADKIVELNCRPEDLDLNPKLVQQILNDREAMDPKTFVERNNDAWIDWVPVSEHEVYHAG